MPVTISVNEPIVDAEFALTVRIETVEDSDGGVTGLGKLMEIPDGAVPIQA